MKLFAGLGNPGGQYSATRHNIGFMVLDKLADRAKAVWKSGFGGEYTEISGVNTKIYLLKPMTFMNLSGQSVGEFCRFYKIDVENLLLIHDELDFPFDKLRLKHGGTAGGHNGVASVIQHIGDGFARLRMGIGGVERALLRGCQNNYVLSGFSAQERAGLDDFLARGADAAEYYAANGLMKAMNKYNK